MSAPSAAPAPFASRGSAEELSGAWRGRSHLLGEIVDNLRPYDWATVRLWQRSHERLVQHVEQRSLTEAAVHAVLSGLRRQSDAASLFAAYDAEAAADLSLIGSVVPAGFSEERRWSVRDAAYWLRWLELTGQSP